MAPRAGGWWQHNDYLPRRSYRLIIAPAYLKQARLDLAADRISLRQFKQIEDRAVHEAIALQQESSLDVVTDGEMRRSSFIGPLADYAEGFEAIGLETLPWHTSAAQEAQLVVPLTVAGKLRRRRSLAIEEFIYARAVLPIKMTLPSPLMLALRWSPAFSAVIYPEPFDLFTDAAMILRDEITELASLGCEYIQIDAPELATLVDPVTRQHVYEARGFPSEHILLEGVDLLNAIAAVPGVTFAIHLCRATMLATGCQRVAMRLFPARSWGGSRAIPLSCLNMTVRARGALNHWATSRVTKWWCWVWSRPRVTNSNQ
jgi:5-methyltetrahydropteroyltriglutamate--homocysteine methyltransferase